MYTFHSDPGHGWLQVKRQELKDIGILDKISHYSYQYGPDVYLEEDCDYSLFFERMKELGRTFEIKEINSQAKDSIVRTYEGFTS
jgi:deoxyadenosine/deoxycytidine kinase